MILLLLCALLASASTAPNQTVDKSNSLLETPKPALENRTNEIEKVNTELPKQQVENKTTFQFRTHYIVLSFHVSDPKYIHVEKRGDMVHVLADDGHTHYENDAKVHGNVGSECYWHYKNNMLTIRFPTKSANLKALGDGHNKQSTIFDPQNPGYHGQFVPGIGQTYEIYLALHVSDQKYINVEKKENMVYVHAVDGNEHYQNSISLPSNVGPGCYWYYINGMLTLRLPLKNTTSEASVDVAHVLTFSSEAEKPGHDGITNAYEIYLPLIISYEENNIQVEKKGNTVSVHAVDDILHYQNSVELPENVGPECYWYYKNKVLTLRLPWQNTTYKASNEAMIVVTLISDSKEANDDGIKEAYQFNLPLHVSDPKYINVETRDNMVYIQAVDGNLHYENSAELPKDVGPECYWYYKDDELVVRLPMKNSTSEASMNAQYVFTLIPNPYEPEYDGITNAYQISLPFHFSNEKNIRVERRGNKVYVHAVNGMLHYQNSVQLPNNVGPEFYWYYKNDVLTIRFPMKDTNTEASVNAVYTTTWIPDLQKPEYDGITNAYEITLKFHVSDDTHIQIEKRDNAIYVHAVEGILHYQNRILLPTNVGPECYWYYKNDTMTLRLPVKNTTYEASVNGAYVQTLIPNPQEPGYDGINNAYQITLHLHVSDEKDIKVETRDHVVYVDAVNGILHYHNSNQLPDDVEPDYHLYYKNDVLRIRFPRKMTAVNSDELNEQSVLRPDSELQPGVDDIF